MNAVTIYCCRMLTALILSVLPLFVVSEGSVVVKTQDLPHVIVREFRDMPASFGPEVPEEGLVGFLVVGEPRHGCTPISPPPLNETNYTKKWIVLLARYDCRFEVKVRNAQLAGYHCAIVHNVNSSDLEVMSAKNAEDIKIPSVFVSDLDGAALANDFVYTAGFFIMVNGKLPFDINTHLLLPFAIVVVLCLIVMIVFMIVKCIKDRRRAARHRLPHRSLRRIPTCKFSKGDPYDTCAICLDDYQDGDCLRVLPCAHAYHSKCIDPWLTQNRRVCPVCKRRVFAAGERRRRYDSDSGDSQEPLVSEDESERTQGGTFVEQRENPFVRAARFMRRFGNNDAAPPPDDEQPSVNAPGQSTTDDDTEPLVTQSYTNDQSRIQFPRATRAHRFVRTTRRTEPRTRRPRYENPRSFGRTRTENERRPWRRTRTEEQPSRSTPSINSERGEIGVAAIPNVPNGSRNVNL